MHRRTFLARATQSAVAFGILRDLTACRNMSDAAPSAASGALGDRTFIDVRDRYFVRVLELNPVTATYLGGDGYTPALHDINGKLRDNRPQILNGEGEFYRTTARVLAAIDPASLSPSARIDHAVMNAQVAFLVHQLDDRHYQQRAVDTYVAEPFRGVDWQIQQMQSLPSGQLGSEDEWQLVVARLDAIPKYLDAARANLLLGKSAGNIPDRRMVERDGIGGSRANVDYFHDTLQKLAAGYLGSRPFASSMRSRLAKSGAAAADAYTQFAAFLASTFDVHESTDRFAVGEKEYEWRVHNCLRDPRTAEQLYQYGAEQVAMYEAKIYDVAQQVARDAHLGLRFGTPAERSESVRKVMDYLAKDSPKNDDELFRWYRDVGKRAVAYGREHDLFDIPSTYRLDVEPTPPVLRSTIDAAYYPAPPFKKSGVGRFYLTPTGNDPAALALNNRASVADTAVHEGFPGHDWHYKYMSEHSADISNIRWLTPGAVEDSSSMWEDSMAAEGWGLYSEELMAEPTPGHPTGFYTPAEYLYELQGQLLRAVRIRVDVGMHTGRMTYDDAKSYFTEHVSFYPGACAAADRDPTARAICDQAERAIYRYSKWPTQAITYNLGKSAIVALRDAYKEKVGSAYSAKRFHEKLMRMGTIPAGYFHDEFLAEA
ncbi:MAG TPA: DUF885 domain-containing protein [Gemmatimonadaceae bacterium]